MSGWTFVSGWIEQAAVPVEVVETEDRTGEAALESLEITTGSPLGELPADLVNA